MSFKFEKLEVWQQALDYTDLVYDLIEKLPGREDFNLKSQMRRASTSIHLNIAEGSTGQTDDEQARFLGMSLRSLIETVACMHQIARRNLLKDIAPMRKTYKSAEQLTIRIQAMRKAVAPSQKWVREAKPTYETGMQTDDFEIVVIEQDDHLSDTEWLSSIVRRPSSPQQRS